MSGGASPWRSRYSTTVEDSGTTVSPSTSTGRLAGGHSAASADRSPSTNSLVNGTSRSYSAISAFQQ